MHSDYEECVRALYDLPRFTEKHPPAHTKDLLRLLGDPGMDLPAVHVAGTNGKGSVCAMLTGALLADGKRVGTFTSPHLVRPNERICLNGRPVSDEMFLSAYREADRAGREMEKRGDGYPTFFETVFAMAMLVFERERPDVIVLETGLGGRLDATNVCRPRVCVITSVSLDHMQILGDTVEKIAAEKAGIVKEGVPLVLDEEDPAAAAVVRKRAAELHAPVTPVRGEDLPLVRADASGQTFLLHGREITVPFTPDYQRRNAALAAEAALLMGVSPEAVQKGIAGTVWPARMEEVLPGVYLDGAHNEDAVRRLAAHMEKDPREKRLLFSAVSDKDHRTMLEILGRLPFRKLYLTGIRSARAASVSVLEKEAREAGLPAAYYEDTAGALRAALSEKEEGEALYIAGSLYLAGEVKALLAEWKRGSNHAEV